MQTVLSLVGRAGTPRPILDKLAQAVTRGLQADGMRQTLLAKGVEPVGGTPEQFANFMSGEMRRYAAAASAAGLQRE
ncbi:hypothetical protein HQN59_16680 [Schlegelella sp. ID0723]|uniref:Tripartite tricarboxylate transporter family receptor n=1 Tax=Piscinibacter koreensis TaxID=2742824 RepID=A0A7Y6TXU0_9BURK|nr:hypothetical protein [Schlegelella koreensis]